MKRLRNILFNGLSIFTVCVSAAWAGIAVEPAFVELNFNGGRASGQFVITNTSSSKVERYRVIASHFTLTETGGVELAEENEHSMASWIKFNPKEFSLPPNSKRVVRYVVLPKKKLEQGQYWAAMELESLEGRDYSTNDGEGRTFNLKVIPSVLAPMFGKAGRVNYDFEVKKDQLSISARNKFVFELEVENKGNTGIHLKGAYEIVSSTGEILVEKTMDGGLLLREKSRKYVTLIDPKIAPGSYKLNIFYGARGMQETITRTLDLDIK